MVKGLAKKRKYGGVDDFLEINIPCYDDFLEINS